MPMRDSMMRELKTHMNGTTEGEQARSSEPGASGPPQEDGGKGSGSPSARVSRKKKSCTRNRAVPLESRETDCRAEVVDEERPRVGAIRASQVPRPTTVPDGTR